VLVYFKYLSQSIKKLVAKNKAACEQPTKLGIMSVRALQILGFLYKRMGIKLEDKIERKRLSSS